jgi:hypothetical protein
LLPWAATTTSTMVTTANMWRDFVVQYWPSCEEAAAYYSRYIIHNSSTSSSRLPASRMDFATASTTATATRSTTLSSSYSLLSWLLLQSPEGPHPQQQNLFGSWFPNHSDRLFHSTVSFSGAFILLVFLVMAVYNGVVVRLQRQRHRRQQRQLLHVNDDDDTYNHVSTRGQQQKRQPNNTKRRQRCSDIHSESNETEPLLLFSSYSLYSMWSTTTTNTTCDLIRGAKSKNENERERNWNA